MTQRDRLQDIFEGKRHQKVVLVASVCIFLVLELLIYLAAAGQSGQKSRIIISDSTGAKVYETAGAVLSSYEKVLFENNFGPLRNYQMRLESEQVPFPFRAWLSSAVGIPVGLTLLMAFLVRAYLSLLYGNKAEQPGEVGSESGSTKTSLSSMLHLFRNFSIFHIGFFLVLAVLILWMVPNFIQDFATVSIAAIKEFQWFFLGLALFVAFLIIWIVYLRYKLSKQMLENQLDLEKFRVEKQLLLETKTAQLLAAPVSETQES
jgi:hypothetical protein